jgi:hypothetical protein
MQRLLYMKSLLTVSSVIEVVTGSLLVAFPSLVTALLLGSSLDAPMALTVARARTDPTAPPEGWSARWRSTMLACSRSSRMQVLAWGCAASAFDPAAAKVIHSPEMK